MRIGQEPAGPGEGLGPVVLLPGHLPRQIEAHRHRRGERFGKRRALRVVRGQGRRPVPLVVHDGQDEAIVADERAGRAMGRDHEIADPAQPVELPQGREGKGPNRVHVGMGIGTGPDHPVRHAPFRQDRAVPVEQGRLHVRLADVEDGDGALFGGSHGHAR